MVTHDAREDDQPSTRGPRSFFAVYCLAERRHRTDEQDTDFRTWMSSSGEDRRRGTIFNSSKLVCGLGQVVIEAVNPAHHPVFGS